MMSVTAPHRPVDPAVQCSVPELATHDRSRAFRALGLLAFALSMVKVPAKGDMMIQDSEHARRLAQNLVELLTPYEEELIQLERAVPAFAPLRRAVGIAIAEACYCISDKSAPQENLVPPADDSASRAR